MWLTLKSVDENALETIKRMGFEATQNSHYHIKVRVKNTDDVQKILSAIQRANVPLPGMDVRKPNLEEVFLSLTGEEFRGVAR